MIAPNTILQNRYLIIRQIGQGGMGAVYMARDQRLRSVVALKESFFSDEQMRRAFEREAELLANLHHPALTNVTDHFAEGDVQFLVMQFIPGEDLAAMMEIKGAPFAVDEVTTWADQLLDALDYLHTQAPPILHRDIKPQNLKLTERGQVILLDFGLAKGAAGQMSSVGASHSVFGFTPNFAPLEQIERAGTDARSDLYALAATLYYLMSAVAPPDALTRASSLVRGQPDPLKLASELNAHIPVRIASVLHAAMAQNPDERPRTAALMREALREARGEARAASQQSALSPTKIITPAHGALSEQHAPQESHPVPAPTVRARDSFSTSESPLPPTVASQQLSAPAPEITYPQSTLRNPKSAIGRWLILSAAVVVIGLIIAAALGLFSSSSNSADSTSGANRSTSSNGGSSQSVTTQMGVDLVAVPAGSFMMGSENGGSDERPVHRVTIKTKFYMSKYEVTQAQWQAVMGSNPSYFKGDNLPVESVSWDDAQEFIKKLNARNDGYVYRLPTEAEWEYACRAGTTGDSAGDLDSMAWYDKNSGNTTHPVGQKQPNAFGLYDINGNVWEWCADWYRENYDGAPSDGSAWESDGDQILPVIRGGAWNYDANALRSAIRLKSSQAARYNYLGVRVVATSRSS